MKRFAALLICLASAAVYVHGQSLNYLSPEEVTSAESTALGNGFVSIQDLTFATPSLCQAQMPSESIFTPVGWIAARAANARKTYTTYTPTQEDTARVLTVLSKGCASGTPSGPACESITRVVLLADKEGSQKVEPLDEKPMNQAWQNGFGASTSCSGLVSRFPLSDIKRVQNSKGEFLIATFDGTTLLKIYAVKEKHLRKLGI